MMSKSCVNFLKRLKDSIKILLDGLKPHIDGVLSSLFNLQLNSFLNKPLKLLVIIVILLNKILPDNPTSTFLKRITIITQDSNIQIFIIKLN